MEWKNQLGSRGRTPWLLIIRDDCVVPFLGSNIPGSVVVRGTDYEKGGKWSCTTYRLELSPGTRYLAGRQGWETGIHVTSAARAWSFFGVDPKAQMWIVKIKPEDLLDADGEKVRIRGGEFQKINYPLQPKES